jgi:adenosylhomocysteine nucleosidase
VGEKRELKGLSGAAVVDMEAAGLARVAAERGIPFYCFKGITDGADQALPDFSAFIGADGRFAKSRFAVHAAIRPWLWPSLQRLARASRRASLELSLLLGETFLS